MDDDVRAKEFQALVADARRKLALHERRIKLTMIAAGCAFVAGMVAPLRVESAILLGVAALCFLASAAQVRGRNEVAERIADLLASR